MLTQDQKTAIQVLISTSRVTRDKLIAMGADDAIAIAEIAKFIPIREKDLNEFAAKITAQKSEIEKSLVAIAEEKLIWNAVK